MFCCVVWLSLEPNSKLLYTLGTHFVFVINVSNITFPWVKIFSFLNLFVCMGWNIFYFCYLYFMHSKRECAFYPWLHWTALTEDLRAGAGRVETALCLAPSTCASPFRGELHWQLSSLIAHMWRQPLCHQHTCGLACSPGRWPGLRDREAPVHGHLHRTAEVFSVTLHPIPSLLSFQFSNTFL